MKPKRFVKKSAFEPSQTSTAMGLRAQIAADLASKYGHIGDIVDFFLQHTGEGVDKWHHYLPLYERYLGPWRNRPLRFLEIGVSKGGSLEMWRKYFGPDAVIFGIDIDPTCARFNGIGGQVRIGSQDDPDFLGAVVDEMGGVDVVLDDGSHMMSHVRASLIALFPRLSMGGTYIIEDLHTAYWEQYGGGADAPANFFNLVRSMIDDMHTWYHEGGVTHLATAEHATGIHIHDSMVVLDKGQTYRPVRSLVDSKTD
jgi:cephalosporin hydroxylase